MMDADALDMLRSSLGHVLTEASERPLSERLRDLGWDEVVADDAPAALRLLFETKGAAVAGGDALGPVLAGCIADALGAPDLAGATVVLPAGMHPDRQLASVRGGRLVVSGIATAEPAGDAPVLVAVDSGGLSLAVAPASEGWKYSAATGTDPALGLVRVDAELDLAALRWIEGPDAVRAWEAAVARGRWAVAAELVGLVRHVIAAAVAYAGERRQYGRAIGSFQAVQHRLASAHATMVGAAAAVAEAASSDAPWDALVAKALAGRAAEVGCTQAQQTYGAIGFTWEHEFHRSLRRSYVLDWLLGDWRTLELEIGTHLAATGAVPRIGRL